MAVLLGSHITRNKEVTSTNSFGFDGRFVVKSLIWIKKSKSKNRTLGDFSINVWPCKTTQSFLNKEIKFLLKFHLTKKQFVISTNSCKRDHTFSTFAKFFEKLTYQGVRNVSFSENLANVLNEWSQIRKRRVPAFTKNEMKFCGLMNSISLDLWNNSFFVNCWFDCVQLYES